MFFTCLYIRCPFAAKSLEKNHADSYCGKLGMTLGHLNVNSDNDKLRFTNFISKTNHKLHDLGVGCLQQLLLGLLPYQYIHFASFPGQIRDYHPYSQYFPVM